MGILKNSFKLIEAAGYPVQEAPSFEDWLNETSTPVHSPPDNVLLPGLGLHPVVDVYSVFKHFNVGQKCVTLLEDDELISKSLTKHLLAQCYLIKVLFW
jgi:hypothetical protein